MRSASLLLTLVFAFSAMPTPALAEIQTAKVESEQISYADAVTPPDRVNLNQRSISLNIPAEYAMLTDLVSRSGLAEYDPTVLADIKVDKKIIRVYETIPFSTITVDDPNLSIGQTAIKENGQDGQQARIYEENYEEGILISSFQIGVEITAEPVQKIVSKGIRPKTVYSPINRKTLTSTVQDNFNQIKNLLKPDGTRNYDSFKDNGNGTISVDGQTFQFTAMKKRTITMFDGLDCCMQSDCHTPAINHSTFSGVPAQRGLFATFGVKSGGKYVSSLLPMGTILFVEGYGLGVVADVHGASKNPELIDVCYDAGEIRAGTARLGKIYSRVYILSKS